LVPCFNQQKERRKRKKGLFCLFLASSALRRGEKREGLGFDSIREFQKACFRMKKRSRIRIAFWDKGDDLVRETLIDEESRSFDRIRDFTSIRRDKRVKEGEFVWFGSQDTSKTLSFLATSSILRGDLNQDVGIGKINTNISNGTETNGSDFALTKSLENRFASFMTRITIDEIDSKLSRIDLNGDLLLAKDDDLITSSNVIFIQKLAVLNL